MTPVGLYDYKTGERLRLASRAEVAQSKRAKAQNGIFVVSGRAVYVKPEVPSLSASQKENAAAKRAARKASRAFVAAHNARVEAERAALAAHIKRWGEDGFETS